MSSSLQAELLQEQHILAQLRAEQAALKSQLEAGHTTRSQPKPSWQGLQQLMGYLARAEQHQHLALSSVDLAPFLALLDTHNLPAIGTLGKQVLPQHTLRDLRRMMRGEPFDVDGLFQGGMACFYTRSQCQALEVTEEEAVRRGAAIVKGNAVLKGSLQGLMKSWGQGNFAPVMLRNVMYHRTEPTSYWIGYHILMLAKMPQEPSMPHGPIPDSVQGKLRMEQLLARDGLPRVLHLVLAEPRLHCQDTRLMSGAFRELMDLSHAPVLMVTCDAQGRVLTQNTFSLAHMGVLAREHFLDEGTAQTEPAGSDSAATHAKPTLNYLRELLGSEASVQEALMTVNTTGTYRERVCLTSPVLRQYMHVDTDEEVYFDVHIGRLLDGITKQLTYVIVQVDVTDAVLAQQQAQALRRNEAILLMDMLPRQVIDVLLDEHAHSRQTRAHHTLDTLDTLFESDRNTPCPHAIQGPGPGQHKGPPIHISALQATARPREASGGTGCLDTFLSTILDSGEHDWGGENQGAGSAEEDTVLLAPLAPKPSLKTRSSLVDLVGRIGACIDGCGDPEDLIKSVPPVLTDPPPGAFGTHASTAQQSAVLEFVLDSTDLRVAEALSHYHEQVTIMFVAIKDFQHLSLSLPPTKVMVFLNRLFSAFDDLLRQHDVYKVESIGDVYMVCSGLFQKRDCELITTDCMMDTCASSKTQRHALELGGYDPDHADKMLDFAKALLNVGKTFHDPNHKPMQLLVGLHAGPIVTGVVGTHVPRFCCFGDTVNTASRMETTARPGLIHASAAFRDLTPDEPWEPTEGVTVKGKGNMETYTLKPRTKKSIQGFIQTTPDLVSRDLAVHESQDGVGTRASLVEFLTTL